MTRTYGRIRFIDGCWEVVCDPHVRIRAKQIFRRIDESSSAMRLKETEDVCADLQWFMLRYPLLISEEDRERLNSIVSGYKEEIARIDDLIDGGYRARDFKMALPAREYQKVAAEVWLSNRSLLLADDLGVGKTISVITALTDARTLPAVVVLPPHLSRQWMVEIERFAPQLSVHIVKSSTAYALPKVKGRGPDVILISYYMVDGWADVLAKYCSSVVFEECGQQLSRNESQKYNAAKRVADAVGYRIGLSATPVQNYGGDIFNVMECISPGKLGSREEFQREWCAGSPARKLIVSDAQALGSWLRSQHLMLRRTKKDVGRELPELIQVTHEIDSDAAEIKKISGQAGELAKIILSQNASLVSQAERMNATGQLGVLMRQATGLAKAPYVATFVEMLIESGEKVLLYGWHRQVYSIWMSKLAKYVPSFYTGTETASQKQRELDRFIKGDTPLLIMSLRSGIGVDGLQHVCKTVVIGELDWTWAVLEQCMGRAHRDGQSEPVTAYLLISNDGIDPEMAQVIGVKKGQVRGIRDDVHVLQRAVDSGAAIRRIAQQYLKGKA